MKFPNQARLLQKILVNEKMSSRDLAEKLGVSQAYVSNMVKGKVGIPAERAWYFPNFSALVVDAAVKDYRIAWVAKAKKGLPKPEAGGKGLKHEKQKAKKEKSKTKNRQL